MALFTGVQHLCTFNIVASLIYHLFPNVWKAPYTISASIFVDVTYWPPYSTYKFISCTVPGPSQWFFHFGEEVVIAWTHNELVWWMLKNLPFPAAQEVRDRSGATPCIVMKNDRVHRCGASGSMRACHAAGPGSIPGRDKFPGWGFFSWFFLTCKTNVGKL